MGVATNTWNFEVREMLGGLGGHRHGRQGRLCGPARNDDRNTTRAREPSSCSSFGGMQHLLKDVRDVCEFVYALLSFCDYEIASYFDPVSNF